MLWSYWQTVDWKSVYQGESGEQQNEEAEGDQQTQRPPRRRFWRPYRRCVTAWLETVAASNYLSIFFFPIRPFRPHPPADQPTEDQVAVPQDSKEQENKEQVVAQQTELAEAPQTNGEAADGQGPKQRRQSRRRRQRISESSTSKVRTVALWQKHVPLDCCDGTLSKC